MAQKAGYFKLPNGEYRYSDGQGGVFHNHTGPWLNQIGNLFGNPGFGRTTEHHIIGADGSIGGRVKGGPGQLPTREELLARGDVPGQLPADYKSTEAAAFKKANSGGGGNDKPAPAPPSGNDNPAPDPPTAPTRQAPPPNPGADRNATGTQMGGVGKPADFGAFEQRLSGDFGIGFNFTGNAPTLPGAKQQQQTNTQYATQDDAFAGAYEAGEVTPYLKGYTGDANDRGAQMAYAYNHGYMGSMDNFGKEGANPEAGSSPVPDKAGQQTGLSFGQGVGQAFDGTGTAATKTVVPRKRRGSARQQEFAERPGNFDAPPESTAPAGRPRRNTSFLDYNGEGGSLMALRALEASQGTMRQNGVTYGKNAGGEWVALSGEAASSLKNDRSTVATVDFVEANQFKPVATSTAEQPEPQDYTPIPKGETKSVGGFPTTEGDYGQMDGATKAAVDIVRGGVDFNSSNVIDGMKDEKDPQSFLMQKLNQVGLGK